MLATFAASALLLAPIPPGEAFKLPSTKTCVRARTLTFSVRDVTSWRTVTVRVDGKRVERVTNPSPARKIRLRKLPPRSFTLTVDARASDGRTATAKRTYAGCPQGKPKVTIPAAAPPTSLVVKDRIVGTGAVARGRRTAVVQYAGVRWSDGAPIDNSYDRAEPFAFPLGRGAVIEGFEQGVSGMRVGGRREVVMPPAMAYGEEGAPPTIPPNEPLVFVIDLIAVKD